VQWWLYKEVQMFKGDPEQSVKELFDEIKGQSVSGAQSGNLNYLMPAFVALLIKLSNAADKRAGVMFWLTVAITALTIILTLLTGALVWDAFERHLN
jgi:hypothetical protein